MSATVTADFKAYEDRIQKALIGVTRNAVAVSNYDLSFHRSINPDTSKSLDAQNAHFLRLTSKLLKAATKDTNVKAPTIQNRDAVDDNWRGIVDVLDDLLEKADNNLDEFNGGITQKAPSQPVTPEPQSASRHKGSMFRPNLNIVKPQKFFARQVDNFATGAWTPLLKSKPHAQVPLEESIGSEETGHKHPYQHEIESYKYPQSMYEVAEPIPFTPPEYSQPIWVDTEQAVLEMLEELRSVTEIAVDLEHNDKNSYIGMVCLLQISTRDKDWVVDTLRPWRENLQVLNEVFANPTILKAFHGSTSDMIWLQRDLGIYIVGLFDTYHAACALKLGGRGLAFLLQQYCHFNAQKQYQMADWRERPLPQELLDYARSDTHYLLYIVDNLRNELIQNSTPEENLIDYVLDNSKKEALQIYERPPYDRDNGLGPGGWMKLILVRSSKSLDKQAFGVLRALHEWRDQTARGLDEGVHSIMTDNYLFNCAMVQPTSKFNLYGNRELGRASPHVETSSNQIFDAIKRGKREGLEGPTVQEVMDRNADKLSQFKQFRHANPNAKPQDVQQSVAATMQRLVQDGELCNGTDADSLRTAEPMSARTSMSALWGSLPPTPAQPLIHPDTARMALMSIMPLQSLAKDIILAAEPLVKREELANGPPTPVQTNGADHVLLDADVDAPFVLRDRKKKRTADDFEAETLDVDGGSDEDKIVLTPRDHRRNINKQARLEAKQAADAEFQPFDYANAQSMLHTKPQPEAVSASAKPINPYAKALDTSTGARRNRLGKELAGKSHTFKS